MSANKTLKKQKRDIAKILHEFKEIFNSYIATVYDGATRGLYVFVMDDYGGENNSPPFIRSHFLDHQAFLTRYASVLNAPENPNNQAPSDTDEDGERKFTQQCKLDIPKIINAMEQYNPESQAIILFTIKSDPDQKDKLIMYDFDPKLIERKKADKKCKAVEL